MKANELRIGNWVEVFFTEDEVGFGKNYYAQVVAIQETKVMVAGDHHYHPIEKIRPIPLTPEILEMAGFTQHHDDCFNDVMYIKQVFGEPPFKWGIYPDMVAGGVPVKNSKPLEYLHQLQNLYFALTGEELTIKMKEK